MPARDWTPSCATRALLVASLAWTTGACGFLWTHGPPESHLEMTSFECTSENGGPTVDLVVGGLAFGAGAVVELASGSEFSFPQYTIPMIGGGILLGVSGLAGLDKTRDCREALRQLRQRLRDP